MLLKYIDIFQHVLVVLFGLPVLFSGCPMKNPLYENSVNGPTVDLNTPLAVVLDFLEIESNDDVDWAGDDESPGFAAFPPPHVTDSPRPIDAPRTPEATQPPSPPPAPTIAKPVFAK